VRSILKFSVALSLILTACGSLPFPSSPKGAPITPQQYAQTIQSIVRQHFNQFRLCYEDGLLTNPHLKCNITVKFIINAQGCVQEASEEDFDIPDPHLVACIVSRFQSLTFPPAPVQNLVKNGTLTVTYPLRFGTTQ